MKFLIWKHGRKQRELLLNYLNEFHPNLKFTNETYQTSVNFVDLNISRKDDAISTDLHIKPINDHQDFDTL